MITLTYRWPHEGIMVGYEVFQPDEVQDLWTVRIHVFILSLSFEWGNDINDYL